MTIAKRPLVLALVTTATFGCAADPADGGGGDGDGGGGGGDPTLPLDATGTFSLRSRFDLATNAPGRAGEIARTFIDATDEGDDPAKWILEQAIAALPNGPLKSLVDGAKPFIAGFVNDRLLEIAPDLVTTMVRIGNDFGDVAKDFGLDGTLAITGAEGSYTATHAVLGARFKIDDIETAHAFADHGIESTSVGNVSLAVDDTGKLVVSDHRLGLPYGKALRVALDGAIIPSLDPTAANLGDLLEHQIDCQAVGEAIQDACVAKFGFGPGASTFRSACTAGLAAGATFIYNKLSSLDAGGAALELSLTGTAKMIDADGDRKLDTIQTGAWTGTAAYGGTPAPLATATFSGVRM